MKHILVNKVGTITDVVDTPFEVHPDLEWYTVEGTPPLPGDVYNHTDGTFENPAEVWLNSPLGKRRTMVLERKKGYGSIASQLDLLYKDMVNGTTVWVDKLTEVKVNTPKVPAVDPFDI